MKFVRLIILLVLPVITSACDERNPEQNNSGKLIKDTVIITTELDVPWEILWAPDNSIWVTERIGRVQKIDPATGIKTKLLEIEVTTEGESGMLGMALHPDFPNTPYAYLVYNYSSGSDIKERLVRYTYQQDKLINEEILINNITGNTYHDGSRLIFGPDGKLYMTTGDAGDQPQAQNPSSLSGKILRINADGSIPSDNPSPNSYVWASGSRNAQGLDFSPSGILYSSEHGPESDDEINIIEKGRNYGWPEVEGYCDKVNEAEFCSENSVKEPIQAYTPTLALAGIAYYPYDVIPDWKNSLIVTSLKAGKLIVLKLNEQGIMVTSSATIYDNDFGRLRDVCVSPEGRVFVSTSNRDGRGNPENGDDKIIEIRYKREGEK